MTLDEFKNEILHIDKDGYYSDDNNLVIDLANSDEYSKFFANLEKNDNIYPQEDNQLVSEDNSSLIYESKDYNFIINLVSDWDADRYQIIISEVE